MKISMEIKRVFKNIWCNNYFMKNFGKNVNIKPKKQKGLSPFGFFLKKTKRFKSFWFFFLRKQKKT